ncbi:putative multidrug resistance protein fnx1 [Xylariomycetidae sp. FL2044]|nr:putative multidrug resistance protein fnx1 [Xylariomycetidae sp. FL2044]
MTVETTTGTNKRPFDGFLDSESDASSKRHPALDETKSTNEQDRIVYLQGPRFWAITACVGIMQFMTNLEVPVVITALVQITDDLQGFDLVPWVVASYMLGYVAVIVIFAKFSDIFGRKLLFLLPTAIFIVFSAACSASQTMVQLIVFRALQGVGGGGCFSLCTIIISELVPPERLTTFVSNISMTNALALLLGPILGGAISSNTTWRWIFIINVPIATPAFVMAIYAIPAGFPYHGQSGRPRRTFGELFSKSTLDRIDIPGTIILLFATLALTSAFEEAGKRFAWKSAYVITLIVVSGLLWIALAAWERHVTLANRVREPILPWRFVLNREMMGVLLNFTLLGGPALISMYILPQRIELVYGTSGLDAGVRLIPFSVMIAVGSIVASGLAGKLKVPPIYLLFAGSALQVLGFALLGTLPFTRGIPGRIYGFEVIAGLGCGVNFALLFIMIPFVNEKRDHAAGMGAGSQLRMMGGAVALSISTAVFNTYAQGPLQDLLGSSDTDMLTQLLPKLSVALQEEVRRILAEGYNRQTLVLCVSAALQVPASLLMWKKKQRVV